MSSENSLSENSLEEDSLSERRFQVSAQTEPGSLGNAKVVKVPDEKHAIARQNIAFVKSVKYFPILFNIFHFSIWGGLGRKGLEVLTTYDGVYVGGVIWANFAACLVMGMAIDSQRVWSVLLKDPQYPTKAAIPLYTGITTGFCGTLSSFSTFVVEAFTKSANLTIGESYHYPNAAYGIMQFLSVVFTQLGVSVSAYYLGRHIAELFDKYIPPISRKTYKFVESLSITIGILAMIANLVLLGVERHRSWRSWTFSVIFSPVGAFIRFYLAKFYNSKIPSFPLGTFAVNIGGTTFLAILNLLGRGKLHSRAGPIANRLIDCHLLIGLEDGFCGSVTTISTFVVEICAINTAHSYRYGLTSVLLSFSLVVLILGSYNWTVGLTDPVCT